MPEIVNVVAAGDVGVELDIEAVAEDIDAGVIRKQGGGYRTPTLYLKETEESPLVTVYESGSYHISGAGSVEEAEQMKGWFVEALEGLGVDTSGITFSVQNVVVVGDLEQKLDLNQLIIQFGFEETEYEPEQFPGLVYRPEGLDSIFLIFASGQVVIPGSPTAEAAFDAFEKLQLRLG